MIFQIFIHIYIWQSLPNAFSFHKLWCCDHIDLKKTPSTCWGFLFCKIIPIFT